MQEVSILFPTTSSKRILTPFHDIKCKKVEIFKTESGIFQLRSRAVFPQLKIFNSLHESIITRICTMSIHFDNIPGMSFVTLCMFAALAMFEGVPCIDYSDLTEYPVYVTYYWPEAGGINCWQDCSVLADNKPWDEDDYGNVAACPMELYYRRVQIPYVGEVHCRDTGPAVKIKWREDLGGYVVSIDVLERVGVWDYGNWLISDWTYSW